MKTLKTINLVAKYCLLVSIIFLTSCSKDDCKKYVKEWNSKLEKQDTTSDITLKAFIENSGSIDGYVSGMGNFKTDIYAILSDASISKEELNYINSQIIPQTGSSPRAFILNLSPNDFKNNGGDRQASDIAAVYSSVLKDCNKKNTILLASDFIFSPGKDQSNVEKYLAMQSQDINNTTKKLLQDKKFNDYAVVTLQGFSNFDGFFWNKDEVATKINEERPFYVLLAGKRVNVAKLLKATEEHTHFNHGYSEFNPVEVKYAILSDKENKVGNFRPCRDSEIHITKCQTENRTEHFEFKIAVDFSTLPLNEKYLLCKDNYKVEDSNYKIVSIAKSDEKNYTHEITISIANNKGKITKSELDITLMKLFPEWIKQSNDPNGDSAVTGKTFGIQPMMEGIQTAFNDNDYYTKIKVFIEK